MAQFLIRYQLANGPPKWSFKAAVENVKRQSRVIFRSLVKKKDKKNLIDQVPIYRSPNGPECSKRQFFSFFESGFFRRATKWCRESLAAAFWKRSGRSVFQRSGGAAISFVGFALANRPSLLTAEEELEGLTHGIRESFSKIPLMTADSRCNVCPLLSGFKDLEIGNLLAKGCNAVVYSARLKKPENKRDEKTSNEICGVSFDLAVKVMFNYNAQSDAATILKAMFKEAVPAFRNPALESVTSLKNRRIPHHPNIVEMYGAFADEMPLLEGALTHYPQALPYRLTKHGYGRNMTLFLVMKRYDCSLKEYLNEHEPSTRTRVLLLCQLLEGLVHLLQHGFVHRDLKTDNILLDLTYGVENPIVAITDFGCCLEGMKLPYTTEEVDRGGNLALMAPEITTAVAGPFTTLDYSRSDLWTLGTIAYEVFGVKNPFYLSEEGFLEAATYSDTDLPPLPPTTPPIIQKLIKDILHRDPKSRPNPSLAATICQLFLFAPPDLKASCKTLVQWMFLMSSETFFTAAVQPSGYRSLELLLRYTFCRRIQFSELMQALQCMSQV